MSDIDCIVVGAGVVGLATARALARAGLDVIILEAAQAIGTGVSSRSSEVIHAGIYYPSELAKARMCVAGKHMLYAFCESHHVEHQRCGKLVVASTDAEIAKLDAIEATAIANGVNDLKRLTAGEARELEPELACVAAVLSPSTGVIDSHGFMTALLGDAQVHGAMLAFDAPVVSITRNSGSYVVETGGDAPTEISADFVVNAAGLAAQEVARSIREMPPHLIPQLHLAKGNYYALAGRSPFRRLIYPVPQPGGLGVHLTFDLAGQVRFGPDVEWVDDLDYTVDPARSDGFHEAIRRYWPGLKDGALQPAYAGIRPKIERPGGSHTDFLIQTEHTHGLYGLINLFGIESPGLTSSLAIAEEIASLAATRTRR